MHFGGKFILMSILLTIGFCKIQLSHPIKALYIDSGIDWNNPTNTVKSVVDSGYNVILFAFYTSSYGPLDMALAWTYLDQAAKQNAVDYAHSKGAVLLVSFGGDTDGNYWQKDPNVLGAQVANWAKSQLLDGVDYDLEGFAPGLTIGNKNSQQTMSWLISLHQATKAVLGDDGFISGAPQGPYLGPISPSSTLWAGPIGGYTGLLNAIPNLIDFFFIQFYNQGPNCYANYNGLMINSGTGGCVFPGTSVNEIISYGVPFNKIIIGKPMLTSDASNGFISATNLNSIAIQYNQSFGVISSFGAWQHHSGSANKNWITTIYAGLPSLSTTTSNPILTAGPATTGTTGRIPSSTSTSTTGPIITTGGNNCSNNCTCTCQCF